ncbi:MAG: methyltransferase domain-containing protein [Chloroflexaceae bacterium]|nr:methyltransferase domain-containing protein [Chloroflexaceae bacterium]
MSNTPSLERETIQHTYTGVVKTAQEYYNSADADRFYATIWGGEDIHIGMYTHPEDSVRQASQRTVITMADTLQHVDQGTRVIDIGAGYGGSARYLARRFGCTVACVNLSETQNERNRRLNQEQQLAHLIDVVDGSFEEIPYDNGLFDIVWSQDAILHSGNRRKVIEEVRRVIKPGGEFILSDPMQSDDCPEGVLQPVLERIHLDSLASVAFYRAVTSELGFDMVQFLDFSAHLVTHYRHVQAELQRRYAEIISVVSQAYVDRMITGLGHWVEAGQNGYLRWGILHFRAQ